MKGRALRRALETKDLIRISGEVPAITDTTEWITPCVAQEMLKHNKANRPINWNKVEEYADIMAAGKWELHAQGIVLDGEGNILTGQKRLWAVVYSGVEGVYMRISRGSPATSAKLLDRGTPQSARDLAARVTERKHSPTEASIARAICALRGNKRPSIDELSDMITENEKTAKILLEETKNIKKTKAVIMILAAISEVSSSKILNLVAISGLIERLADKLDASLKPETADKCWGKGAAFSLAMEQAKKCILE